MTDALDPTLCPTCEVPLPRPMISEETADAKARLALLKDFEAIIVVPKLNLAVQRAIPMSFFLTGSVADLKKLVDAVHHLALEKRRIKSGDSDGP